MQNPKTQIYYLRIPNLNKNLGTMTYVLFNMDNVYIKLLLEYK